VEIIYLDDALLVVDKPAGLPVIPDGWDKGAPYVVQEMERDHGKVWVVHRLDKVTSGVLILARTAAAHRLLSLQFQDHEAQKTYHAIANGMPSWDEKTARHRLTSNVGHKHRTVVDARHGKPSETVFRVLERYTAHVLLEARPLTGRTHQVRAHLSAIGFPLLGDALYGAPATQLIARPALHAYLLTIRHPGTGAPLNLSAPYPEDFRNALSALEAGKR
jgi:RluA family pseudouridine synthase